MRPPRETPRPFRPLRLAGLAVGAFAIAATGLVYGLPGASTPEEPGAAASAPGSSGVDAPGRP